MYVWMASQTASVISPMLQAHSPNFQLRPVQADADTESPVEKNFRSEPPGSHARSRYPLRPACDKPPERLVFSCAMATGESRKIAAVEKIDVLQGTLDLMVLQTLEAMGPLHGYGIARRIEQVSQDSIQLNQGTIYAALLRLQQRRWITAAWGVSDNNRKAKFYSITSAGRRQLAAQAASWARISTTMTRLFKLAGQE